MKVSALCVGLISASLYGLVAALPAPNTAVGALTSRSGVDVSLMARAPPPIPTGELTIKYPRDTDVQNLINEIIESESVKDRGDFTRYIVGTAHGRWSDLNWVVVDSVPRTEFYQDEWRRWKMFTVHFQGVEYRLYYFVGGSFRITGSMGPQSFDFAGTFVNTEQGGKLIHFVHESQL